MQGVEQGVSAGDRGPDVAFGTSDIWAVRMMRWMPRSHQAAVLAFFLLVGCATLFLTVEADEAWILLSTRNAFGDNVVGSTATSFPTVSSGGLHTLLHGFLGLVTSNIVAHRMISLAFAALLLRIVWRMLGALRLPRDVRWAGLALFTATPTFWLQSSLAMAEVIATTLVIASFGAWAWQERLGRAAVPIAIGTMALACATRIHCLVDAPVLSICLLLHAPYKRRLPAAILATALSILAFVLSAGAYLAATYSGSFADFATYLSGGTGIGAERKAALAVVSYFIVAEGYTPALMIISLIGYHYTLYGTPAAARPEVRFGQAAIVAGLCGIVFWACRSPLPHVRYLWPAIGLLWLAFVLALLPWFIDARPRRRLVLHAGTLAMCAYQLVAASFFVLDGESGRIVYELARREPLQPTACRLCAGRAQSELARRVRALPDNTRLYVLSDAMGYPITYLTHRPVFGVQTMATGLQPRLLLNVPTANWHEPASFTAWRERNTSLLWQQDGSSLSRINSDAPTPADRVE